MVSAPLLLYSKLSPVFAHVYFPVGGGKTTGNLVLFTKITPLSVFISGALSANLPSLLGNSNRQLMIPARSPGYRANHLCLLEAQRYDDSCVNMERQAWEAARQHTRVLWQKWLGDGFLCSYEDAKEKNGHRGSSRSAVQTM